MERDNFPTFRRIGHGIAGWSARRRQGLVEWVHGDWLGRLRRLGIGLLALFVLLAIPWTYFNITLGMKLEEELEEIRQAGQPLTLQEAVPEMPPRDENAAYVYEEAFRVFQKWEPTPEGAAEGTPLDELSPRLLDRVTDGPGPHEAPVGPDAVQAFVRGELDDLPEDARKWLFSDEVEQRLDAIKRASRMERAVFPVNWEDGWGAIFPHFSQFREAQRLVTAHMMIAGREGRTEHALEWCKVGLRMSNHIGEDPLLVAFLVRVAMIEVLSRGAQDICDDIVVPAEQAQALGRIASGNDVWQHFRRAMEAERASELAAFEPMTAEEMESLMSDDGPSLSYWRFYQSPLGAPVRKYDQLRLLEAWDHLLRQIEHPLWEIGYDDRFGLRYEELGLAGEYLEPVTRAIQPLWARVAVKRDHAIARLDQFHIALALNLYRQEHGEYPRTLEPLAGTVDWSIPDDIFSGEPFGYRRRGEGYMLWSVGPDLDDDGGVSAEAPGRSWDDSDIVWRAEG